MSILHWVECVLVLQMSLPACKAICRLPSEGHQRQGCCSKAHCCRPQGTVWDCTATVHHGCQYGHNIMAAKMGTSVLCLTFSQPHTSAQHLVADTPWHSIMGCVRCCFSVASCACWQLCSLRPCIQKTQMTFQMRTTSFSISAGK